MRRILRLVTAIIPVAALAACVSPTAPATSTSCMAGKVPYSTCENRDYVNPLGDYVNPLGDYVNPLGDYVNPLGSIAIRPGE